MTLYLVATPIGNLEDITLRALRVLKEVDLIACEDTRHTRRLLEHFGITKPTISYHEHNESARAEELVERMLRGEKIALVTDAGTPGISDPAYRIVRAAIDRRVEVIPIPGATALITGLIASGLPTDAFFFGGFLPQKKQARRSKLEELAREKSTLIFYEAPHRICETLVDALEILGDREAALARELTKLYEQFIRGPLSEIAAQLDASEPRGELTLVIAGNRADNLRQDLQIHIGPIGEEVDKLIRLLGLSRNEAIKEAARSRGLTKREAYQQLLQEKEMYGNENDSTEPGRIETDANQDETKSDE
jgi:16S rRNA (cytidine1402-2'-O)-methyltransferase